jgi:hypothetical protein
MYNNVKQKSRIARPQNKNRFMVDATAKYIL